MPTEAGGEVAHKLEAHGKESEMRERTYESGERRDFRRLHDNGAAASEGGRDLPRPELKMVVRNSVGHGDDREGDVPHVDRVVPWDAVGGGQPRARRVAVVRAQTRTSGRRHQSGRGG